MNLLYLIDNNDDTSWHLCHNLVEHGFNILVIGETKHDQINPDLLNRVSEYCWVPSLEDYEVTYKTAAYLIHKYGRLSTIVGGSNRLLPIEVKLNLDFNLKSGLQDKVLRSINNVYKQIDLFVASGTKKIRFQEFNQLKDCSQFIEEVGFPLTVLTNKRSIVVDIAQLEAVLVDCDDFMLVENIVGSRVGYICLLDDGEIVYEDMISYHPLGGFYIDNKIPKKLINICHKVIGNIDSNSRFVYLEFIKLSESKEGVGRVGDYIGSDLSLTVPSHDIIDIINFTYNNDVYSKYSDVLNNKTVENSEKEYFSHCLVRDKDGYKNDNDDIMNKYNKELCFIRELEDKDVIFSRFKKKVRLSNFIKYVLEEE